MSLKSTSLFASLVLITLSLTACNWDGPPSRNTNSNNQGNNTPSTPNTIGSGGLQLEIHSEPSISNMDAQGKTTVLVQFIVRDSNGVPMQDDAYNVQLFADDAPIDVESILDQDREELDVNLYLSMVLDASYSMTQHNPPAFEPMKAAARNSFQEAIDIWMTRPGNVKFSLVWFDEVINQSQFNDAAMQDWMPSDILTIPSPMAGSTTKLYSAVQAMGTHLQNEFNDGVFNGPRDKYVMLVFSDGKDNYSWFDNSSISMENATSSGAPYITYGATATSLADATASIRNHPNLTTHVIGLGTTINAEELQDMATAGGGVFLQNPNSENIDQLFQRITNEFTTLQTRGAHAPFTPGEHKFRLRISNDNSEEFVDYSFSFVAGENGRLIK